MKTQPKTEPSGPPFDRHEDPNANSRDRFDYYRGIAPPAFPFAVQRLIKNGFTMIGYTDPHKRIRRLYANPIRVRDGRRNPWASVGPDGGVIYYQFDPRPAATSPRRLRRPNPTTTKETK